ncbi:E3 ubiquitin-protein ligase BRE1A-like [Agelaius phoeniceus]|uniref:E3 ubiquitin-protein ligase BRE1A-like n=1 Tax=Agelaius phoeniceus TaxID=39638 RepID=UPI0040551E70
MRQIHYLQQSSKLQERVETAESRVSVLETMIADFQWDIDKIRKREQRLNHHLATSWNDRYVLLVEGYHNAYFTCTFSILSLFYVSIFVDEVIIVYGRSKAVNEQEVLKKVVRSVVCCRGVSVFADPINREMHHLISSLQNHNHQLKGEVLRYKRKLREAQSDLSKIHSRSGSALLQSQSSAEDTKEEPAEIKQEPDDPSAQVTVPKAAFEDVNEMKARQDEEERVQVRWEREREREKEKEKEKERE